MTWPKVRKSIVKVSEKAIHRRICPDSELIFWRASVDGNYETYTCSGCGAAVTVPVGASSQ